MNPTNLTVGTFTDETLVLPQHITEDVRHLNLPFGWWEPVYLNFKNLASYFGLAVDLSRTCFSGFYHDTAGCSYEAEIDVQKLLCGLKEKSWQTLITEPEFIVPDLSIDPEVIRQLEEGEIRAQGHVRPLKYKTRIYVALQFKYPIEADQNYLHLDGEIEQFIDAVIELCDELNQILFTRLQRAYECLISATGP
jgi:hypothetical protein